MSILGLPTEILDEIADFSLWPGSFESLALSCRALYEVCKGHIARYNELLTWGRVSLKVKQHDRGDDEPYTIRDILLAIAQDRAIARFIEELDLYDAPEWDQRPRPTRERGSYTISRLRDLVRSSPYLALAGQDLDEWTSHLMRDMKEDDSGVDAGFIIYQAAFLLTQLPNLREFTPPAQWTYLRYENHEDCKIVLEAVVRHVLDSITEDEKIRCEQRLKKPLLSILPTEKPLAKLERVLPFAAVEYDPAGRGGLVDVAPFMLLPNMKHLHVSNLIGVDDNYTGISFQWPYDTPESGLQGALSRLESIHLEGCIVDTNGISNLVSPTPHLRSFRYSHHTKWHGCAHDWNTGEFVDEMAKHVGNTLRELTLNLDVLYGEVESGISTLKAFKVLESFEADVRLFCAAPFKAKGDNETTDWKLEQIPPLYEILPESIRSVKLVCRDSTDSLGNNVDALEMLARQREELQSRHLFPIPVGVTLCDVDGNFDIYLLASWAGWGYVELCVEEVMGDMPRE